MNQTTLLMIKPDVVQRGLIGEIISRIEKKGLKIVGLKMATLTESTIERLYDVHLKKSFFPILKAFIMSGPIVIIAIQGSNAVKVVRKLCGVTNSPEAEPGTIRGDFGLHLTKNIVHSSDKPERAHYELGVLFKENEIQKYTQINEDWIK